MISDHLIDKIVSTEEHSDDVFRERGKVFTFLNPVSYLDADGQRNLYCQFDGIFADGSLMVLAIRLLYHKTVRRRSFDMTSLAKELFEEAAENGKTLYIVASAEDQVKNAVIGIKKWFPRIRFAGYRSGYFNSNEDRQAAIEEIIEVMPDYLIVGMGAIKQEEFLLKTKEAGFTGIGFTCGGFISQTVINTKELDYYPRWIDNINLRFLYRMYKEPHTRRRYLKAGVLFPIRLIVNRLASIKPLTGGGQI